MAFSSSSASRWTRSLTRWPWMSVSGTPADLDRARSCSTSEAAARSTSTSGTGWLHRRPGSSPASTSRFSPLRRMRVARWSIRKRLSSWSGSASLLSSSEIEAELALDEALVAAGEVGEDRVDVAAQQRLLGGEPDRLAVHLVEGAGHLADLVRGVDRDRLRPGCPPGPGRCARAGRPAPAAAARRCRSAAVRRLRMLRLIERAIRPATTNATSSATSTTAELMIASRRASEAICGGLVPRAVSASFLDRAVGVEGAAWRPPKPALGGDALRPQPLAGSAGSAIVA